MPPSEESDRVSVSDLQVRFTKDPNIVFRDIEGETILVPIRRRTANLQSIFTLNETAALIWDLIDGQRTVGQILSAIVEEYDIGTADAQADLLELLGYLEEIEAVERV